ncbi:MDC1 protein, partial [Mesembrinibis cayennensis]|nr:MDC1 protein [Mesembrinibis cayennensis]
VATPAVSPTRPRGVPTTQVLFTGVVASPGMEVALKTLGGSMATSVFDCTHLVTDRVRRTVKFLCAVARGVPIVTPEWLHKVPRGWGALGTRRGSLGTGRGVSGDKERFLGDTGSLGDKEKVLGDVRALGDMGQRPWGHGMGSLGTRDMEGIGDRGVFWGQRRGLWGQGM